MADTTNCQTRAVSFAMNLIVHYFQKLLRTSRYSKLRIGRVNRYRFRKVGELRSGTMPLKVQLETLVLGWVGLILQLLLPKPFHFHSSFNSHPILLVV